MKEEAKHPPEKRKEPGSGTFRWPAGCSDDF